MNCSTRQLPRRHRTHCQSSQAASSGIGALTITDTDSQTHFEFDVPGFDTEHITIDLKDGQLSVTGELPEAEHQDKVVYSERCCRSFARAVRLSDKLDPASADAVLKDGVLTLTFARRPDAERRRIQVRGAAPATEE